MAPKVMASRERRTRERFFNTLLTPVWAIDPVSGKSGDMPTFDGPLSANDTTSRCDELMMPKAKKDKAKAAVAATLKPAPPPADVTDRRHEELVDSTDVCPQPTGRKLTAIACDGCQRRRCKCDGVRPACQSCRSKGINCVFTVTEGYSRTADLKQKNVDLNGTVRDLEGILYKLKHSTDWEAAGILARIRTGEDHGQILGDDPSYSGYQTQPADAQPALLDVQDPDPSLDQGSSPLEEVDESCPELEDPPRSYHHANNAPFTGPAHEPRDTRSTIAVRRGSKREHSAARDDYHSAVEYHKQRHHHLANIRRITTQSSSLRDSDLRYRQSEFLSYSFDPASPFSAGFVKEPVHDARIGRDLRKIDSAVGDGLHDSTNNPFGRCYEGDGTSPQDNQVPHYWNHDVRANSPLGKPPQYSQAELFMLSDNPKSFGNLPMSSAIRANGYPSHVQTNQVANLSLPMWAIQSMIELDDEPISLAYSTFLAQGKTQIAHGTAPSAILGSSLNPNALFDRTTFANGSDLSKWAACMAYTWRSVPCVEQLFMMRNAFLIMSWQISPTAETYAKMPDWSKPTPSQLFISHPIWVDYLVFPGLRDICFRDLALLDSIEWLAAFDASFSCNWPNSVEECMYVDGGTGVMHLNPMFEQHINHVENLTVAPEIAQFFHVEDDNVRFKFDDAGNMPG
ncbi:hypothetical protein LTR50_003866 [Elasticomyces elasticus]|nr:hypothetical protein LTR50_003866 [Elasticomyces elasticus]